MKNIISLLEQHGYYPFINLTGDSVSFYMLDSTNNETLMTVNSFNRALTLIGY